MWQGASEGLQAEGRVTCSASREWIGGRGDEVGRPDRKLQVRWVARARAVAVEVENQGPI